MKQEFNLSYVYYFLNVAETGSISHSAEWMHITQPTLSNAISTLEKELDVQLFDRIGKNRIVLNRYGKCFYDRAREAFFALDQAVDEIRDMKNTPAGNVRFSLPSPSLFSATISRFVALYPNVSICQSTTDLHFTRQQLLDGKLDFAVSYLPHPGYDFDWFPFLQTNLKLIVPMEQDFHCDVPVSLSSLANNQIVLCTDNNLFPDLCNTLFSRSGIQPHYQYIGPNPEEAAHHVLHNRAFAIVCPDFSRTLFDYFNDDSSVKFISVDSETGNCEMGFVLRKKHYLPYAAKELISMIANENGNLPDFTLKESQK